MRALIWLALFTASRWRVERQWRAMAMSNRPNSPVSYKMEHHKYLVTLSPLFTRAGVVCKSGVHKAEQPHLWRVIKPQSGERGGEAAAKQESLRLRPCHKPSIPALRGAHILDHGRGNQRFGCDECALTLTEPHSKEPHSKGPHSMLIRAFARARNRETGPGIVTLCIMKSETFAPGASDKTLGRLNVGGRSTPAAETLD